MTPVTQTVWEAARLPASQAIASRHEPADAGTIPVCGTLSAFIEPNLRPSVAGRFTACLTLEPQVIRTSSRRT